MPIRVYIVEDHPIMRETLIDYLSLHDDLEYCGSACCAEEALEGMEAANPSVVLLDLSLPGRSGLDVLAAIQSAWRFPCIILSGHRENSYVGKAIAGGARGYILKGQPAEIPIAIRKVMSGEIYLSDSLRSALDYSELPPGA